MSAECVPEETLGVSSSSPAVQNEITPPTGTLRTKKMSAQQDSREQHNLRSLQMASLTSASPEESRVYVGNANHPEMMKAGGVWLGGGGSRTHSPSNKPPFEVSPAVNEVSSGWSGHYSSSHGHASLRSDAYLRQALTSPYNQRAERHTRTLASSPLSARTRTLPAESGLSPWKEGTVGSDGASAQQSASSGGQLGSKYGSGPEGSTRTDADHPQHTVFKTPKMAKRMMFGSPDKGHRAMSATSSPLSSVSGSSGSGHHGPLNNPFEMGHDRLHFPVFSPGMFKGVETPGRAEETFQWNLEHIAELRPVHIDDKEIRRQMSKHSPDDEAEQRAQRAIDYYFQHHMVAPSPWSENPPPHVLPCTPAQMQGFLMGTPNENQGSIQKELERHKRTSDKTCQTALTIPMHVDLDNILADYMTYQDTEETETAERDSMSSSSLRRKLFFYGDSSSLLSPSKADHLSAALCTPPHPKKSTPEWERESPVHSPASVQFSSSPIRGPFSSEGDYFRTSFSDLGGLASPELSPIGNNHKGKTRGLRKFPSLGGDTFHGDETSEFGSNVRQQLQMEVHDGSSTPPLAHVSPAVSPIACHDSGSGRHSRSFTIMADASLSPSASPNPQADPPLPLFQASPHPSYPPGSSSPHSPLRGPGAASSMDTDGGGALALTAGDGGGMGMMSAVNMSQGDGSMMDVALGEGGSGLDPLHHQPSSLSNLDPGYQTGSGNGSLHLTQDGGSSSGVGGGNSGSAVNQPPLISVINSSSDALLAHPDTSFQLRRLAAKLRSGISEHGFDLKPPGAEERGGGGGRKEGRRGDASVVAVDDSSVDGMGSSVDGGGQGARFLVHSNLTNQFMSMPYNSENGDPETSQPFDTQGFFSDGNGARSPRSHEAGRCDLDKFVDRKDSNPEERKLIRSSFGDKSGVANFEPMINLDHVASTAMGKNVHFSSSQERHQTQSHSQSPRVLDHSGTTAHPFQSKDHNSGEEDNDSPAKREALPRTLSSSTSDCGISMLEEDSVLERARQYLASVKPSDSRQGSRGGEGDNLPGVGKQAEGGFLQPPPESLTGLSTPTRRALGKVAEDLTQGRDSGMQSPALASEVAKEILRRAELDLRRVGHKKTS